MNISQRFIQYPIMTTLLSVALVMFGIFGYLTLPVSQLPNVDFPTIQVSASLAGADPATMATAVAVPLENAFTSVSGIAEMTSSSQQGQTNITIQFNLDRSIDGAALDVQTAIASALPLLPKTMINPPTFQKVNPADSPVLVLFLSSKTLPMTTVDRYAETQLARQLSTLDGVAQITVFGAAQYAVRIQADPNKLAARGIGIDQLTAAVQAMNVDQATGSLNGKNQAEMIDTHGQLNNAEQFRSQIVYSNGAPVYLGDVANVIDSINNVRQGSWYKGQPTLTMFIARQPGANTIAVVDEIKGVLSQFEKTLPPGIDVGIENDQSLIIRASVDNVQTTLLIAAFLVVGVIFVFLRKVTATIIPALALPISVIGTFAGMRALGFSLDNLSLMALILSVGFVVDDAIVMLENIVRHIEHGEKPYEAAMKGSAEIGFTILSMTLSLAAVFIPIAFMSGIVGRLLNEFAITIIIAILFSGLVSITLTPMLCARFLRSHDSGEKHNVFYRISENTFNHVHNFYERTLRWSLAHKPVILGLFGLSLLASITLFWIIPMDFLPSDDIGQLGVSIQSANGTSYENMAKYGMRVSNIVNADPNVLGAMLRVNSSGAGANQAMMSIHLKDVSERSLSADQVARELRAKLGNQMGVKVFITNPPSLRIGGLQSASSYQYTLKGQDLAQLQDVSNRLMQVLQQSPVVVGVTSDFLNSAPAERVDINRAVASSLGVTLTQIESAMGEAFGGQQVGTIYNDTMQYQVIMELLPQYQSNAASLGSLYIKSANGKLVPLSAVTNVTHSTMPLTVNHSGEVPAVTVSFDLAQGYALSDAVAAVQQASDEIDMPATVTGSFQGTASAFQASTHNMGLLLLIAVLVVYIILGILYESFIHPLTILSGLPSAAVGALLTLYIVGLPLTLYAFVGMIMLIGIVKKNAIMMIDFALQRERSGDGVSPERAVYEASIIRFRPIMMTTMCAIMGTLPIAFGTGLGADGRRPLGLCVAGGLLLSQLLTLYITPVIYVYMAHLGSRLSWRGLDRVSDVPAE